MKCNALRVSLFLALASVACAQTFDAASVKAAVPGRFGMRGGPGSADPGRITYFNVTLKDVLTKAYRVDGYQVEGPASLEGTRYDILATVPSGASDEDLHAMLRNLLAERFGLAVHRESKELPIYALVVGKNGPKMKPAQAESDTAADEPEIYSISQGKDGFPVMPRGFKGHMIGMKIPGKTMFRAKGASMAEFSSLLSSQVDRPVVDFTDLTGKYDFGIAWTDDFDVSPALQYTLGLKLEPRRGQVEKLVVDRVERQPTEN